MSFARRLSILFIFCIAGAGQALAAGAADRAKADITRQKSPPPAAVKHLKPQAPIVMGRSVAVHRKTKLHHVKVKPLDSIDNQRPGSQ